MQTQNIYVPCLWYTPEASPERCALIQCNVLRICRSAEHVVPCIAHHVAVGLYTTFEINFAVDKTRKSNHTSHRNLRLLLLSAFVINAESGRSLLPSEFDRIRLARTIYG